MPRQPQFVVTEVGLEIKGRPTYDEWAAYVKWAAERVKTAMWILGDWLVYGENQWPERYPQAESITGLSYSTLTGASWVAKSIPICRRRQTLEWWPHSEVAGLDPPEQDKILNGACCSSGWPHIGG